jgi:two-component system sensor histidine kinase PhcS
MSSVAVQHLSSQPLEEAYQEFDTTLRVRQAKICCFFALTLVPACIGMDYFVYPDLLWALLRTRLLCDLAVLPFAVLLFTPFGVRHVKLLGNVPCAFPGIAICWMIYLSEGVFSPYYAGLNLVMVAVILLVPYTLAEGIRISAVLVGSYGIACLFHLHYPPVKGIHTVSSLSSIRTLTNNLYFLIMTATMSLAACHYSARRRFTEFSLRYELDANNLKLATTVQKLQETEVQLVQSEKMNALGKLSAGLLHEVNNPLNYTFMALQAAECEIGDNANLRETLADIGQGMTRIKTVISDLRAFAYPSKANDLEEFELDDAVTTALRLTAQELTDIPVDRAGLLPVKVVGGKTQIMHVFMNLLVNSAHALKAKKQGDPPAIKITNRIVGDRLFVSVRDNGAGVRPENLPRLLEPFFTTKPPGEGVGLGLSICHTIVKNHGGSIKIESELGMWTEMTFDLSLAAVRSLAA